MLGRIRKKITPASSLTAAQQAMYALEKGDNFRWAFKMLATASPYVLGERDRVSLDIQRELADLGQFAELAHGLVDPTMIWNHLQQLRQPDFPLYGYDALEGSSLARVFHGDVANLQGYVAYRPTSKQLVISFSGTSSALQAWKDVNAVRVRYNTPESQDQTAQASAHAGFWGMYKGVRSAALDAMKEGLASHPVKEIVFTAHSMGAVMVYFLVLELLAPPSPEAQTPPLSIPEGCAIKLALFGCPRVGNVGLADYWRTLVKDYKQSHGQASLVEWSVKAYNDGVPTLPMATLGYRHLAENPYYLHHGNLYAVPATEVEHSLFHVSPNGSLPPPEHPLGGHNYYGGRDMEKLQRLMRHAVGLGLGTEETWCDEFLRLVKCGEFK